MAHLIPSFAHTHWIPVTIFARVGIIVTLLTTLVAIAVLSAEFALLPRF